MNQKGQSLTAGNLQELLDSATNADQLGGQQFVTPLEYAKAITIPLGEFHGAALDFEMGTGNLLLALNPDKTHVKLGVDIDERVRKPNNAPGAWQCTRADVTRIYELWRDVDFTADTIVINPPFSLRWHADRLSGLLESGVDAVAEVAAAIGMREGHESVIDSTLASFLIAFDRLSYMGEGLMVCNQATAIRFLGDPDGRQVDSSDPSTPEDAALRAEAGPIGAPLRQHVWLWLTIPGSFFENVCSDMQVAVLYFARNHRGDPAHLTAPDASLLSITNTLRMAAAQRRSLLRGSRLHYEGDANKEAPSQFEAARQEYGCLHGERQRPFNIWLDDQGVIQRHLTNYQKASCKVDRAATRLLNEIHGQRPMALVVQRATRAVLLGVLHSGIWSVQPELLECVEKCLAEYNAVRAPFYPLNDVQRLGYLDEEDTIVCKRSFAGCFTAGEKYNIYTATRKVTRPGTRKSMSGETHQTELTGLELFITIRDGHRSAHTFTHHTELEDENSHRLEVLLDHFTIPPVADVAQLQPEKYQRNLARITELEQLINAGREDRAVREVPGDPDGASISPPLASQSFSAAQTGTPGAYHGPGHPVNPVPPVKKSRSRQAFTFRHYQRDDLARSTMHPGLVFAWDTGLGKTAAIFGWSWLHFRESQSDPAINSQLSTINSSASSCSTVLIVAPGGLHEQIIKDAREIFGLEVKRLYSQDDFRRDALLQSN